MGQEKIEIIQVNDRRIAIISFSDSTEGSIVCGVIDDIIDVFKMYRANSILPLIKAEGLRFNENIILRLKHLFEQCVMMKQNGAIVVSEDTNFQMASLINKAYESKQEKGLRVFHDTGEAMNYLLFGNI